MLPEVIAMNRVTKISVWLAIGLCIVAAPAIFPGAAAAQTLEIHIKSDLGGPGLF